jgi:putative serine protease PepD
VSQTVEARAPAPWHSPAMTRLHISRAGTKSATRTTTSMLLVPAVALVGAGGYLMYRQGEDNATRLRRVASGTERRLKAQDDVINSLSERLSKLEADNAAQPDIASISAAAQPSVFTIQTGQEIATGFVVRSSAGGSELITNFHSVQEAWNRPDHQVRVRHGDEESPGTIVRVDEQRDVAVVHVGAQQPVLTPSAKGPVVGDPVVVVGSPLGLGGTTVNGVVSALRQEFIQVSAPTSPGSSGSPVIDRNGTVIGVVTQKFGGNAVEGLSFAAPIADVCSSLQAC